MSADPYHLDETEFGKVLQQINATPIGDDLPDEIEHPLRNDIRVATLCDHVQEMEYELFRDRKPEGGMSSDTYFEFEEGLILRTEIIVKIIIDYIKQHPEIIT
jgi:hypothetical protein